MSKVINLKSDSKTLQPVGFLIDGLKSEDPQKRINSLKNLSIIANAIGPERTKNELILFINELLDDEDEVLITLADSIPLLIDYIGGPQYFHVLLGPLEKLCYAEESSVRDKAIQNIKKILASIQNEDIIIPLIKRLINGDFYTAKSSVSSLIPAVYPKVSNSGQNDLMKIYYSLCTDEIPLVRKSAAINMKDLIKNGINSNENEILNCLKTLMKDDQDFVRIYLVDAIVALMKVYNINKTNSILLPFTKSLADDLSWRIRYSVIEKFFELGQGIGKESNKKYLLAYYIKFLQDPEPEIKTISAIKLAGYCELLDADDIVNKIIPNIKPLATDQTHHVRAALAGSLLQLCPLIGKKYTNDHILAMFLSLLKDGCSDVRVNLFKNLDEITKVIDIDTLSQSLLSALNELAVDKSWRTRSSAVEFLSFFARKMGENFLNEKFSKILLDWLQDKVFGVREAAIKCVKSLTEILGAPWVEKQLLPKILAFHNNPNYLHRLTPLFVITSISLLLNPDYLSKQVLPILQTLAKDQVPNVRMNTCKALKSCFGHFKEKSHEELAKKLLITLSEDSDSDVKLVAKQLLLSQKMAIVCPTSIQINKL